MAELRWLTRIGNYEVIRREIPRPGGKPYYLNGSTLIGVLHTTEGDTVEAAWRTLRQQHAAPHFIAGENRIVQCRPLNAQASTLRPGKNNTANVHAQVQVEMVARSKQKLWLPKAATLEPTVAILAFCQKALGIPLRVPNDWPDDCADMPLPWAANNRRRRQAQRGLWPKEKGWWMHLEVPYQGPTWHWDCGAVRRTRIIALPASKRPTSDSPPSEGRDCARAAVRGTVEPNPKKAIQDVVDRVWIERGAHRNQDPAKATRAGLV